MGELSRLPPLVTSWEVESLKRQLAEAAQGERFLLQGGDCAESFAACESSAIAAKLKILLQMSLALVHGARRRVIRVGRFAGHHRYRIQCLGQGADFIPGLAFDPVPGSRAFIIVGRVHRA